jgi:hypothetical protein
MNVAMEQTEEYQDGQLKAKYGDAFIRGNNSTFDCFSFAMKNAANHGFVLLSNQQSCTSPHRSEESLRPASDCHFEFECPIQIISLYWSNLHRRAFIKRHHRSCPWAWLIPLLLLIRRGIAWLRPGGADEGPTGT